MALEDTYKTEPGEVADDCVSEIERMVAAFDGAVDLGVEGAVWGMGVEGLVPVKEAGGGQRGGEPRD